jgi:hypothetical protein
VDFNDPEGEGLPGSRNFFLESEPGVRVGVWQILPAELAVSSNKEYIAGLWIRIRSAWIRINLSCRIRIQEGKNDLQM